MNHCSDLPPSLNGKAPSIAPREIERERERERERDRLIFEGETSRSSSSLAQLRFIQDIIKVRDIYDGEKMKTMDGLLDSLFEKRVRGATREKALSELADGFTNKLQHKFVSNKAITLLQQCLISLRQGSTKEIHLASRVIGLLSISAGCNETLAHEIFEDSVFRISRALMAGSEPLKISSLLDCLAIVTLVGGISTNETERSMEIVWQVVYPKSNGKMVMAKPTPAVLAKAIYAWSFLLTTVSGYDVNPKIWKESLSYFSNLLDQDEPAVRIAASVAIALIFARGSLEKFSSETMCSGDESVSEEKKHHDRFTHVEDLKGKILYQVKNLSMKEGGEDTKWQHKMFQRVSEILEDGHFPNISVKIGKDALNISTWHRYLQLNFLKEFLGVGFGKHMQENELLHNIFDYTPKQQKQHPSDDYQNLPSSHEVMEQFFLPEVRKAACSQRMLKSPNSVLNKARCQLMNKKRTVTKEMNTGHFDVTSGYND